MAATSSVLIAKWVSCEPESTARVLEWLIRVGVVVGVVVYGFCGVWGRVESGVGGCWWGS